MIDFHLEVFKGTFCKILSALFDWYIILVVWIVGHLSYKACKTMEMFFNWNWNNSENDGRLFAKEVIRRIWSCGAPHKVCLWVLLVFLKWT